MTELEENSLKINISQEDTKVEVRKKVWDYMKKDGLKIFPGPPRRRISNFKGSDEAGLKLAEMEEFKGASIVRVDPMRPLQEIRIKTLMAGKTLLVPTPRLLNHVYSKVMPPADADQATLLKCISRENVKQFSSPIDIDEMMKVDLVIVASLAVSTSGIRVGKGGGLSDLEYAMMASLGVVDETVPVVTMVHDDQVLPLPENLLQTHDLPVDFIITPTRVIKCQPQRKRPTGVIWKLINEAYMTFVPVLRRVRFRDWKRGIDVRLSGEEVLPTELTDELLIEAVVPPEARRKRLPKMNRRPPVQKREGGGGEEGGETTGDEERKESVVRKRLGRRRNQRPRNRNKKPADTLGSDGVTDDEKKKEIPDGEVRRGRGERRVRNADEGTVYVGSLPRNLKVSQFKSRVRERMVNPLRVFWRGQFGFAFLNFKTMNDAEKALAALEGLSIKDRALKLEMAKSNPDKKPRQTAMALVAPAAVQADMAPMPAPVVHVPVAPVADAVQTAVEKKVE